MQLKELKPTVLWRCAAVSKLQNMTTVSVNGSEVVGQGRSAIPTAPTCALRTRPLHLSAVVCNCESQHHLLAN